MAREGSEIWIYLSSFQRDSAALSSALAGGLIGAGIGVSLCALVYYAFAFLPRRTFLVVFFALAALVVGGLSMQLAKQGLQTGVLDSGRPIWDTSWLVSERSWFGQFLHALFGYDANPDMTQVLFYFGALTAMAIGAAFRGWSRGVRHV
jgi:high-affinity iron transporter